MRTLRELGWQQTWVRLLRRLSVRRLPERAADTAAAFLGAPRFGELSAGAATERPTTLDRGGRTSRGGHHPAHPRLGTALALDPTIRETYPYVAALLEELQRQPLPRGAAKAASRRRAAR